MLTRPDRNAMLNLAGGALAAYGIVAFWCGCSLFTHWANISPATPDPAHGYIFLNDNHGSIRYFSRFAETSCSLLLWTSIPLVCVAMALTPKTDITVHSNRFSVGATWKRDDPHGTFLIGTAIGAIAAPLIIFLLGPPFVTWLNALGIVLG